MIVQKRGEAVGPEVLPGWLGPAYGAAYFGTTIITQVVATWVIYFYAPAPDRGLTSYVPVALVGVALSVGRVVDALADPLVGVWSDNTRSRWGRRIPFMVVGAPLMALTFALLWRPPVAGESTANFIYLAVMSSLLLTFFTVCVAPYLAMLPGIARTRPNRVWLASWQAVYTIAGVATAMIGASFLIERHGFSFMGTILALVVLLSFTVTIIAVRGWERDEQPAGFGLREAVSLTLRNRPYIIFVMSQVLFWFGFNIILATVSYFVTVIMGLSEGSVGLLLAGAMVVAGASIPLLNLAVRRWGLKTAFMITMGTLAAILTMMGGIGMFPAVDPVVQGVILFGLSGIPLAGLFILPTALTAEIIDLDAETTGRRREAIYYGVAGLLQKSGLALSSLVVGGLLHTFGMTADAPWGIRLSGPTAALFVMIGLGLFSRYPLGERR